MSCCLYWVILEERMSVRVLASAVDQCFVTTGCTGTCTLNCVTDQSKYSEKYMYHISFLASQCGDDPDQVGCLVLLLPRLPDIGWIVLTMMKLQIKLD